MLFDNDLNEPFFNHGDHKGFHGVHKENSFVTSVGILRCDLCGSYFGHYGLGFALQVNLIQSYK
jgi:hypothetical protein